MKPRILINVAAFAVLGLILAAWALNTLIKLDALEKPYPVTADFTSSPGLQRDLEVTYLGVRVGTVSAVNLQPGKVAVQLQLNRGTKIPENVGALVLRKSAIGEPYIDLAPPNALPADRPLKAGDHIPLSRTSVTVEYKRLFDKVGKVVRAIDPKAARTLTHELAAALDGRGQTIHDLIGDAHQLTSTLAANATVLDQLSTELTQTSATLSGHRGQLASGISDLATFTAALRSSRKELETTLNTAPGFLQRVNALLTSARPGLGCLLTAAGTHATPLFTPVTGATLRHLLGLVPTIRREVSDIVTRDSNGTYVKATFVITLAGPLPAAEYATPVPKPTAPALQRCSTAPRTRTQAPRASSTGTTRPIQPVNSAGRNPTESPAERLAPLIPVLLAGIVLGATAARTFITAARHRSKRR